MAVKKRPAACQASNMVVKKRPAAPAAVNLDTWAAELDVGHEPDPGEYTNSVYLVTLARVLASTLAGAPHLRDPSGLSREEIRAAIWDALENPELHDSEAQTRGHTFGRELGRPRNQIRSLGCQSLTRLRVASDRVAE